MHRSSLSSLPDEPVSHEPGIVKRVMLRRGEVPHVMQFAQATFAPGQVAPAHAHADMWETFLVHSGRVTFTVDGERHELGPGDTITLAPGERHEVANEGREPVVLVYFGVV